MVSNRVKQIKLNKKKRNRKHIEWGKIIVKIFFWLVFLAFWGFCFWALLLSPLMQINKVNIVNDKVDKTEVEKIIKEKLTGTYLKFLPKSNLLLAPIGQIEKSLIESFHIIKEIQIQRVFPTALLVIITERESMLIWCAKGDCFLVDETGEAFYRLSPADPEWNDTSFVRIEDKSQNGTEVGHRIIDPKLEDFCQRLPMEMQQKLGIEIEKQYSTPSSMSGEIRIKTKAGWEIYVNTNDLLDNQINILKQVIDSSLNEEKQAQLEYIDLRLRGRVTYKLRNQEEEQENQQEEGATQEQPEEQSQPTDTPSEEKKDNKKDKKKNG